MVLVKPPLDHLTSGTIDKYLSFFSMYIQQKLSFRISLHELVAPFCDVLIRITCHYMADIVTPVHVQYIEASALRTYFANQHYHRHFPEDPSCRLLCCEKSQARPGPAETPFQKPCEQAESFYSSFSRLDR